MGAWRLGALADRSIAPLRLYARLELVVAASSAVSPWLLSLVDRVYLALGGTLALGSAKAALVRLALAGLVIGLPTVAMGGTLPALARAITLGRRDAGRRGTATLYAVNTLGAFVGAVVTTFVALETFGARRSLLFAALVNAGVALLGSRMARHPAPASVATREETASTVAWPPVLVLAGSLIVGFAFFLMEMVFARMLAPLLGGTVYTFGLVLAVALLGMGGGSALYAWVVARRPPSPAAFAATCLMEAVSLGVPFVVGDHLAVLALRLRGDGRTFWGYVAGWTLMTAILVLPASIVSGVQFPLLVALLGRGERALARHVGLAYASNTVGAVVGALAGGFGLMRVLSATGCWRGVVLLLASTAMAASLVRVRSTDASRVAWHALFFGALVVSMLVATGPTEAWRDSPIGAGRTKAALVGSAAATTDFIQRARGRTVWAVDGLESRVSVSDTDGYAFVVNGKVDGACRGDAATQVMGGLLGALLHPGARSALVIGLGTGSTAGWLARVPGIERVDVIEIEPAVREVARLCAPVNERVLESPTVHFVDGDAREVLRVSRARYDMIFSEPSNPYRAGVASLYTREYYDGVLAHLEPHGLFVQWVQSYEVDAATVRTLFATLAAVFPEIELWSLARGDLAFVASREPIVSDVPLLRARTRGEPFARALRATWDTAELEGLLAHFLGRADAVRSVADAWRGLRNTDDRPVVEFGFARGLAGKGIVVQDLPGWPAQAAGLPELVNGDVDLERARLERAERTCSKDDCPELARGQVGDDVRARLSFRRLVHGSRFGEALVEWGPREPVTVVEERDTVVAAVRSRDPRAETWAARLARSEPTEAAVWQARLLERSGRAGPALDALGRAFAALRVDPWTSGRARTEALALAADLADQATAERIVPLLLEPFAIELEHDQRLRTAVSVARSTMGLHGCRRVVDRLEPFPPWDLEVLEYRRDCYAASGDPRAGDAAADVRRNVEEWAAEAAEERRRNR